MRKEYLQPFLKASQDVSEKFFGVNIEKSEISLEKSLHLERDVIVALGIKGNLSGVALFGLKKEEALDFSSHVLSMQGIPGYKEWDELSQSVLLEFGNQVVGYVTQLYEQEGFLTDITTPSFIDSSRLLSLRKDSIYFEISTKIGSMAIKLHIQKN